MPLQQSALVVLAHPCDPGAAQFFPTLRAMSKLGSKAASKFWSLLDSAVKRLTLPQHVRLPVLGLQIPRITPAVTLLAMAMAATKEMRDLWNSIDDGG